MGAQVAESIEIEMPHFDYAISAYYVIATAEDIPDEDARYFAADFYRSLAAGLTTPTEVHPNRSVGLREILQQACLR